MAGQVLSDAEFMGSPQAPSATPASPVPGSPTTVRFSDNSYAADVSQDGTAIPANAVRLKEGENAPPLGTPYVTPGGVLWSNGPGDGPPAAATPHDPRMISDADFFGGQQGGAIQPPAPIPQRSDQGLGFVAGLEKPLDNAAVWLGHGLDTVANGALKVPGVAALNDFLAHATGLPDTQMSQARGGFSGSVAAANADHQAALADAAAHGVKPGLAGEIGGSILGTLPIALVTRNPWIAGGLAGALTTDDPNSVKKTAMSTALGALGGKLADAGVNKISAAIAPRLAPAVKALMGEGVDLTPGQILGGVAHHVEDGLSHVPVLGDLIKNAQGRSVSSFNAAALNRVLAPLGEKLPAGVRPGNEGVEYATNRLSDAYNSLLPTLTVQADQPFASNLAALARRAQMMPAQQVGQFNNILDQWVRRPLQQGNLAMTGQAMKQADSEIGRLAAAYKGSADAGQRELGHALTALQAEMRDLVARSNPQQAAALNAINQGWAQLVRVQRAAGSIGAAGKEGVFTPAQLLSAARASDQTVRKGAFATGKATMQDLAQAGQKVLPSTVPDSGTAGRGLLTAALLGGGHAAHVLVHPPTGIPLAVLSGAYTKGGQRLATRLLTSRPASAAAVRDAFSKLKGPAATVGGQIAPRAGDYLLPAPIK